MPPGPIMISHLVTNATTSKKSGRILTGKFVSHRKPMHFLGALGSAMSLFRSHSGHNEGSNLLILVGDCV